MKFGIDVVLELCAFTSKNSSFDCCRFDPSSRTTDEEPVATTRPVPGYPSTKSAPADGEQWYLLQHPRGHITCGCQGQRDSQPAWKEQSKRNKEETGCPHVHHLPHPPSTTTKKSEQFVKITPQPTDLEEIQAYNGNHSAPFPPLTTPGESTSSIAEVDVKSALLHCSWGLPHHNAARKTVKNVGDQQPLADPAETRKPDTRHSRRFRVIISGQRDNYCTRNSAFLVQILTILQTRLASTHLPNSARTVNEIPPTSTEQKHTPHLDFSTVRGALENPSPQRPHSPPALI